MNRKSIVSRQLEKLFKKTPTGDITREDKIVVFSDVHMGNGGKNDDFAHNADLWLYLLEHHYLPRGYKLILNGDIEDLYRCSFKAVLKKWQDFYRVFDLFRERGRFVKLVGNHDYGLYQTRGLASRFIPLDACKLRYRGNVIFIFHGHQAGYFFKFFQPMRTFFVRHISNPLGLKNYSVAFDSRKRYDIEKRVYRYAREHKILALIGHTHRPLFESLSRVDTLKFYIEKICRDYPAAGRIEKREMEERLAAYKQELHKIFSKQKHNRCSEYLYSEAPVAPCLFNSGCCIGKNGVTAIEIAAGNIELVYWFDRRRSSKYTSAHNYAAEQAGNGFYWRVSLKKEALDYVFTRIRLLS